MSRLVKIGIEPQLGILVGLVAKPPCNYALI